MAEAAPTQPMSEAVLMKQMAEAVPHSQLPEAVLSKPTAEAVPHSKCLKLCHLITKHRHMLLLVTPLSQLIFLLHLVEVIHGALAQVSSFL